MNKSLIIKYISRATKDGEPEILELAPGVNVIVGRPNTGKTQWLRMLDYLMGDRKSFTSKFPQALHKYETLSALIEIDGEEHLIERNWKVRSTKVIFDGVELSVEEFSTRLMELLDIPVLHFPSGNPYSRLPWPTLSWRTLLRHIYRRNDSWAEIAAKQPEEQQVAAVLLFLGLAERLFSDEYGELVEKRKAVYAQESTRERFLNMLQRVTRELLDASEVGVAVTPDAIAAARGRLEENISTLEQQRQFFLAKLQVDAETRADLAEGTTVKLREEWANLQVTADELGPRLEQARARVEELSAYVKALETEATKLARTQDASLIFAKLKVTHCPACRQAVSPERAAPDSCYVCGQIVEGGEVSEAAQQRLDFEREQIRTERLEAQDLLDRASRERDLLHGEVRFTSERLRQIDAELAPLRTAAAAVLPPELGLIDTETGRLQERIRQLDRVHEVLDLREEMSEELAQLEQQVEELKSRVDELKSGLKKELRNVGDIFQDAINDYLNEIKRINPRSWTQNNVTVRLTTDDLKIRVGGADWETELGTTLKFYLLFAYNYGLLKMSSRPWAHYPGICILDLPGSVADGIDVKDAENFVIEPFIQLVKQPQFQSTQVIATGNAFESLEGARRIDLDHVWVAEGEFEDDDVILD